MSLAAVYDGQLSRLQLTADGLGPSATYAIVERALSLGVTDAMWAKGVVRGGSRLPVESEAAQLDDYEFFAADPTFYRIRSFDADDVLQQTFTTEAPAGLLAGRLWLKSPDRYPVLNRPLTDFGVEPYARAARVVLSPVAGRSLPVGSHDLRLGRAYTLRVLAETVEEADELDIILAGTTRVFLHVPPEINIPGGWFAVGGTGEDDMTGVEASVPRVFTLPLTQEAPPSPQVTSTLLTAQTLFRLYGSANALYAAHSTGRSLLATIGDPEDVIVL